MFAIVGLATSLSRGRIQRLIAEAGRENRLPRDRLEGWITEFANEVGRGWGPVTVYHLLAELGIAPKPDRHLTRSVIRMGLYPGLPTDMPFAEIERIYPRIVHHVAREVIVLVDQIAPGASLDRRRALREVDKVLMEWSRTGLVRPL